MKVEFYKGNRQALLNRLQPNTVVVIAGHCLLQQTSDMTYPLRQDSNMRYLADIEEPNAALVFTSTESFIITKDRSEFTALWSGEASFDDLKHLSGVDMIMSYEEGYAKLQSIVAKAAAVAVLYPTDDDAINAVANPGRSKLIKLLKSYLSKNIELIDIRKHLMNLRMIKQPEELQNLKKAIEITALGYRRIENEIASVDHEYQLQAIFSEVFESNNTTHAYSPIIASGKRSCVLHYDKNNLPIEDNLVLFDVAAQYKGYMADVSRTISHKSDFSKRQQAVYDAVLAVQTATIEGIELGMTFVDIDKLMRKHTANALVGLGLSDEPSIEDTKKYLPHSSHFIGLDVHDVGDYQSVIPENAVFTIEPGIYIPDEGIGVRIEDMIHLTKNGAVNMTKAIKK